MLAALMYHRVGRGKHANPHTLMRAHLEHIQKNYPVVLPGDPLRKMKLSVCLTFDDATYDFYHYLYPLLKELKLKALLAVCPYYILKTTSKDPKERLSVPYTLAMQEGIFETKAPFCTYQELAEMIDSGVIEVASHSYTHPNLRFKHLDLDYEVVHSKEVLEKHLPQAITSFVHPFGKTNEKVDTLVKRHYTYTFRIGSALNLSWGSPTHRIPADNLSHPKDPLTKRNVIKAAFKSLL